MIRRLRLSDFRNYNSLSLVFDSKINLIIGDNGQGKTNLLEAIYFLSFLRSFRTNRADLIKQTGSSNLEIESTVLFNNYHKDFKVIYGENKLLKIDGNDVKRASDFIGFIKPVVFTHDDIKLISSSARYRRRYLDILLSSADKLYLNNLHNYITALKSRNSVLRCSNDDYLLKAYDPILAKYGQKIIDARYKIISDLEKKADSFIKKIKGTNYNLNLLYYSKIKQKQNTEENFISILNSENERDRSRTYTGIGPHMDDLLVFLNGKNLKNYGSVGQCRLCTLCIKMAEAEIIAEKEKNLSIALIDDVTGELDSKTKDAFYSVTDKFGQLFYTFCRESEDLLFKNANKYFVADGKVTKEYDNAINV